MASSASPTHTHHTYGTTRICSLRNWIKFSTTKKKKKKVCRQHLLFLHGHWLSFLLHPVNYNGTNYSTGRNELTKISVITAKHYRKFSLAVMVSVFFSCYLSPRLIIHLMHANLGFPHGITMSSRTYTHTHMRAHSPIVMIMDSVLLALGSGGQHKLLNGLWNNPNCINLPDLTSHTHTPVHAFSYV